MGRRKHVEPLCRAVTQTVRKDDHKCRSLYVFPLRYTTIPSEANSTSTALPKYGKQRVLLGYVFSTDREKNEEAGSQLLRTTPRTSYHLSRWRCSSTRFAQQSKNALCPIRHTRKLILKPSFLMCGSLHFPILEDRTLI